VKDVPEEHHHDLDYLIAMLDWDKNVDPEFGKSNMRFPVPVGDEAAMKDGGYIENWVVYSTPYYSSKELTVLPGRTVTIKDAAACGVIVVQGWGSIGKMEVETPAMIRFGEMTSDELFVSLKAAQSGVKIVNKSKTENLVLLKHFGPGNPEAKKFIK
jgi:hypothetical protein